MVSRSNAEIPSGDTFLAAWLYRPDGPDGGEKRPLVIMGHGIGGVREMRLDAYAERFAAADLGVLVFDYRYLGASGGQPRQLVSIKRQLEDWASAIAFARRIPWVDPSRIALWGSSFGGGHVLAAAAKDGAVAAVVSQCPFIDGRVSLRAIPIKVLMRMGMLAVADVASRLTGREPVRVPVAGEPGSTALMTTPGAKPAMQRMAPPGYREDIAARIAFEVGTYRPGRYAAQIACPTLFAVCDHDAVTPPSAALRAASAAPRAEVKHYPVGHFDIYFDAAFEAAVADQCEFLTRHLLAVAPV